MHHGNSTWRKIDRLIARLLLFTALLGLAASAQAQCTQPVYITIDTGHMGVATLFSEVLQRQKIRATFFIANEKTLTGGSSLDDQ